MTSRRTVLAVTLGALAAGAAGIAVKVRRPAMPDHHRRVQGVIHGSVPGLVFEGGDLAVVADYAKRKFMPAAGGGDTADRDILKVFLLCTNYFDPARAPGGPVVVVRPPDPYEGGCSNPLAVFDA